ncbi:MAG: DUF4124 domain-containing protein [Candidatus Methylumidiphilus sp.]
MQPTYGKQTVKPQSPATTQGRQSEHPAAAICLAALALALAVFSPGAQATYRWMDEKGEWHYTDQLPPEQAKRPHAKINDAAKVVDVNEGQKTPEQVAEAKRLTQLRLDQQRILREQRDSDTSLMRTYRSEEEMQMALQNKLNTMESAKKIAESNRLHQVEVLQSLVKRAADTENAGQKVPQNLRDSIESTRRQIALHLEKIRTLDGVKAEIVATFKKDLERFKNLEALRLNPEFGSLEWQAQSPEHDVNIASAVSCAPKVCDLAWTFAKDYIKSKTNRPLVTETPTILQTAGPREEKDMSLLVVRITGKTQDTLFLDTSCHISSIGEELCAGDVANDIRGGFKPYIEEHIKAGVR